MSEPGDGYGSWRALAAAVKSAAAEAARHGGPAVADQILLARFDRFLSRVFAGGADSEWLLKGGSSMLARVARSRSTTDVDLVTTGSGDLAAAVAALQECVQSDLGDHLTFELVSSRNTGHGDAQAGSQMRRLVFNGIDRATGRTIGQVPVDLVIEPPPTGRVEVVEPANRLRLPKPVPTHPYRLFPIADHVADKVCAIMTDTYGSGRASSRVKDLVDLAVIASTQKLDLAALRVAIATEAALRGLRLDTFQIPDGWGTRYAALASKTPAARGLADLGAALPLIASLVNPALLPTDPAAGATIWVPGTGWTDSQTAAAGR